MNRERAKVLIADCHEDTLTILQKVLEDAGFDTTAVWTSREFVDVVRNEAFDVVLVNEYMPGRQWEELLQVLRETHLPCILMQPRTQSGSEFAALDALGIRECVCKHDYRKIVRLLCKIVVEDRKASAA